MSSSATHISWTETGLFRHLVAFGKHIKDTYGTELGVLTFRGTVKLHGTNISITRQNNEFFCQSRNSLLTVHSDLYGFANWFEQQKQDKTFITELHKTFDSISANRDDVVTVFGEWVGPGIQAKVAVSSLPHRKWFIFGARVNDLYVWIDNTLPLPVNAQIDNIAKYDVFFVSFNINDVDQDVLDYLEQITRTIEDSCPVGLAHGVQGIGEGIVWTAVPSNTNNLINSSLMFKTKGEKHSNKNDKQRAVATISPEKLQHIEDVISYICPEARLLQGLQHVELVESNVGQYIKWISQDVIKEETDTILENELTWKDVSKGVSSLARHFFIKKLTASIFNDSNSNKTQE